MAEQVDDTVAPVAHRAGRSPDGRRAGGGRRRDRPGPRGRAGPLGVPELATGVDLIGEYEASGYKEAPCLVRRQDGQTIQLTPLLYATLELIDGRRDAAQIAAALSERMGRAVSADNVRYLVAEKLRPTGSGEGARRSRPGGAEGQPAAGPALAAAGHQRAVDQPPGRPVRRPLPAVGGRCRSWSPSSRVVVWVLGVRGLGGGARQLLYSPGLMLLTFGLMVVSASFHEFGHAAACRYSGGRPGGMGCGLYLVWPAFYTDVTDAYRLDRTGPAAHRPRRPVLQRHLRPGHVRARGRSPGSTRCSCSSPCSCCRWCTSCCRSSGSTATTSSPTWSGCPTCSPGSSRPSCASCPGRRASDKAPVLKPWVRVVVALWVLTVVPLLALQPADGRDHRTPRGRHRLGLRRAPVAQREPGVRRRRVDGGGRRRAGRGRHRPARPRLRLRGEPLRAPGRDVGLDGRGQGPPRPARPGRARGGARPPPWPSCCGPTASTAPSSPASGAPSPRPSRRSASTPAAPASRPSGRPSWAAPPARRGA